MKIIQRCKIKFVIKASYVTDEVEFEVAPLDTCDVMF